MRIDVIATYNEDFNMALLVEPNTPEDDISDICYSELEDSGYFTWCRENGADEEFDWEYGEW